MTEPMCAACFDNGRGLVPAAAFTRTRDWVTKEFVPGRLYPLCRECFDRRWEMTGGPDPLAMSWEEGLAEWQILQVQES